LVRLLTLKPVRTVAGWLDEGVSPKKARGQRATPSEMERPLDSKAVFSMTRTKVRKGHTAAVGLFDFEGLLGRSFPQRNPHVDVVVTTRALFEGREFSTLAFHGSGKFFLPLSAKWQGFGSLRGQGSLLRPV